MNAGISLLALGYVDPVHVFSREPTADDYAIWEKIPSQSVKPVYFWHMTESSAVYDRGVAEILKRDEPADAENIAAAEAASREPQTPIDPAKFHYYAPCRLLDAEALTRIVGRLPNSTWLLSPDALASAHEIVRVSWPAYSKDRQRAWVFSAIANDKKAGVYFWRFEKDADGVWQARVISTRYFTRWKNGLLDDRDKP